MAKKVSHVHRLKKHKYPTGNAVFFCTLPDCHYKIEVPLAFGKRSSCNMCGESFVMSEYSIKLNKPHCSSCGKVKIVDESGRNRYVKKISNQILSSIATGNHQDLRSRLNSTTKLDSEEDI